MSASANVNIPGSAHSDFARDLVAVCRKHKMRSINATYRAGYSSEASEDFSGQVTIMWSEGRHGAEAAIVVKFEGIVTLTEEKGATT